MTSKLPSKNTGLNFERVVTNIQARIDPNATVAHNQRITDKLGHSRQFDVVIKGNFAGQNILGVIECKDLNKKVGTPEVDAFVTKSQNINANFKIIVSKLGFSKSAIKEAKHYGIQTLSLIPNDHANYGFKIGGYWFADIYSWKKISLTPTFVDPPLQAIQFDIYEAKINGKRVLDWFTNYLCENHLPEIKDGWVPIEIKFQKNQVVNLGKEFLCSGLVFAAERAIDKKRKFVGINADGFFDWQNNKAMMPAQENIMSDAVETNFIEWENRINDDFGDANFINITIFVHNKQFEKLGDVIDLENL